MSLSPIEFNLNSVCEAVSRESVSNLQERASADFETDLVQPGILLIDKYLPSTITPSVLQKTDRLLIQFSGGFCVIEDLINRMDDWLRENRPEYYSKLLPGIDDAALDRVESQFQLQLPAEFRALYRWRNGQPPNVFESFQENWMFPRLKDIVDTKKMLDSMIGEDFDEPTWWRRGWIPFLSNGGGDHLCLDLTAEDGGTPGQIILFWHDEGDRDIEFPSVRRWLSDLVHSMEQGTLELD